MTNPGTLDAINAEAMAATPEPTRARLPRATGTCTHEGCGRNLYGEGLDVCTDHVEDLLGIPYWKLSAWARDGWLHPERPSGEGPGSPRRWPAAELEIARAMARLTTAGLPVEFAARFARSGQRRFELAPGIYVELAW